MSPYRKHIVIVGSARSGTSWFSELIALQHRYRMLFEPEHEFNTKHGKLICDRYLTVNNSSDNINAYLKKVFANRVDCDWIAQISNRKWKRHLWPFVPKKYIIKFVRCNLSAHYLATHFKIPVVYITRNPYEVIASQQRVKFPWLYDLSWFQSQEDLCDLLLENYDFDIKKQNKISNLEKLCIRWCIENSIPFLQNDRTAAFEIYKYEEFKNNMNFFLEFCKLHNLKPLDDIETTFTNPSSKTHPKSNIITGESKALILAKDDYQIINKYLDIFEINLYDRKTSV
ncbi:sulfotransferase domain-containing protein [Winogradskyella forsetii]|uniref:sulfotransferase domain-containing protein n=2 Tax=Winogradskyella forsetii TaxID=2686077 RepID=UPI0015BC7B11|nr:sulfotransferase domain-containing protein [Winogradskyella forsetii]